MAHLHSIYDSDLHFVIDPVTRVITNQSEKKNSVIQFDHNSERFTFELPRYMEHDMLTCNRVEVHYLNIESKTGNQREGIYEVQDLQVSPHDDKVVICSWLVSNNATQYAGTLNFVLRFACTQGDVVDYVWNTAVFKNYAVQNGLYNSDPIVEQYPDVLAQWYESLFTASADGVTNIQEAKAAAITAVDLVADERIADIEQAGSDVIASLPPEYLELIENVAPPIVESASGATIAITDSADRKLRGLNLYGKSTQDGTPTPEAPVEIESVENPTVEVAGGNLIAPIDQIAGDMSVPSERIYCGPNCGIVVKVTKTRIEGIAITNNRLYPCVLLERDSEGVETPSYPESVTLPSGSGSYVVHFTTKPTTKSVRINFTNNNSDKNLNTRISDTFVTLDTGETPGGKYASPRNISLTRTLPGIPVTSGGNYTDENGQQWVCDEVDFERGVYVQRVKVGQVSLRSLGTLNNGLVAGIYRIDDKVYSLNVGAVCDRAEFVGMSGEVTSQNQFYENANSFGFSGTQEDTIETLKARYDGATIHYVLATPIETALTPEELAAYASLRSNYPNTSVLNDGGAGMAVAYVADTKLYIDNKFSI